MLIEITLRKLDAAKLAQLVTQTQNLITEITPLGREDARFADQYDVTVMALDAEDAITLIEEMNK